MDRQEFPPSGPLAEKYPHLSIVIRIMVYDNGGVNRMRTEEEFWKKAEPLVSREPHANLIRFEQFLASLTAEERESLGDGDHDENQAILARDPIGGPLDSLLNTIFDEAV